MAIKELQTRIALKYDSYANWTNDTVENKGANLVLLKGEIGICAIENKDQGAQTAPTVLFKVGDGTTPFKSLKWASALAADVYGWAKKSEEEFKTWLDTEAKFATDAEVEAIRSDFDSRITAIEGSVGTGKVAEDITAIKGRLDAIEGTEDIDGTIVAGDKATLEAAKTYAEGQASDVKTYVDGDFKAAVEKYADDAADAAQSAAEGTAAAALAEYKGQMDTALAGKQDVIAENTYDIYGSAAGVKTYVDGDFKTEIQGYADGKASAAETAAKGYTDGIVATEKSAREAEDLRLAGLIGGNTTAINKEIEDRAAAVKEVSDKVDVEKVSTAIATAKSEAIAAAKSETDGQVSALTEKVNKNTSDISDLSGTVSSEISRVEGLVTAEKNRAEGIESGLASRLADVEAFFTTKDAEGNDVELNAALDTLYEIQKYITEDGTAAGNMVDRIGANEEAIENLSDRMDTAEDGIGALEGRATAVEGRATTLEGKVAALEAKPFDTYATKSEVSAVSERAEKGITDAKNAQDEVDALEGVVGTLRTEYDVTKALATANEADISALDGRVGTAEGKITDLETASAKHAEKTYVDDELAKKVDKTAYEQAIGNVYTKGEADDKFALASVVSGHTTDIGTNASDITALTGRVGTAEGNITTLQGIVETGNDSNANLRSAITDLQTLTGADGAIRQEIAAAKKAGDDAAQAVSDLAAGQVATNKTNIETISGKVTAIENDYVKASDLAADFYIFNCGSATTVDHVAPKN